MNSTKQDLKLLFRVDKQGLTTGMLMIFILFGFSMLTSITSHILSFTDVKFLLFYMGLGSIVGLGIANRSQAFQFFMNTGNTRFNYFKSICIFNVINIFTLSIVFIIYSALIDLVLGAFSPSYYLLLLSEIIIAYIFTFGVSTFIVEICFSFGALNGFSSILFISAGMIYMKKVFIHVHLLNNGVLLNGTTLEITSLIIGLLFIIASMFLINKCEVRN